MSVGWFTDLDDAKNYFKDERLETTAWDDLDNTKMTKLINQAYNRIYNSPKFSVPTYAQASATQLAKLRIANAEMAYYLAVHLADEDRRKGLQAQGVSTAGVVQEGYDVNKLNELPFPPIVLELLDGFKTEKPFFAVDIDRDEDESVDEDVVDV